MRHFFDVRINVFFPASKRCNKTWCQVLIHWTTLLSYVAYIYRANDCIYNTMWLRIQSSFLMYHSHGCIQLRNLAVAIGSWAWEKFIAKTEYKTCAMMKELSSFNEHHCILQSQIYFLNCFEVQILYLHKTSWATIFF